MGARLRGGGGWGGAGEEGVPTPPSSTPNALLGSATRLRRGPAPWMHNPTPSCPPHSHPHAAQWTCPPCCAEPWMHTSLPWGASGSGDQPRDPLPTQPSAALLRSTAAACRARRLKLVSHRCGLAALVQGLLALFKNRASWLGTPHVPRVAQYKFYRNPKPCTCRRLRGRCGGWRCSWKRTARRTCSRWCPAGFLRVEFSSRFVACWIQSVVPRV